MRPAGAVREALLRAARELTTPERAPTLVELARKACVAEGAARRTVDNMCRAGALQIARTRKVPYRNRAVAEYAPSTPEAIAAASGFVDLATLLSVWSR